MTSLNSHSFLGRTGNIENNVDGCSDLNGFIFLHIFLTDTKVIDINFP